MARSYNMTAIEKLEFFYRNRHFLSLPCSYKVPKAAISLKLPRKMTKTVTGKPTTAPRSFHKKSGFGPLRGAKPLASQGLKRRLHPHSAHTTHAAGHCRTAFVFIGQLGNHRFRG